MEDVIYFMLYIVHQVDISYDQDLECLMAMVYDNGEYKTMIRV